MTTKIEPIEDLSNKKISNEGFFLKKNHAIFLTVIISFLFAGSILATYFGKPETVYEKYTYASETTDTMLINDAKTIVYVGSYSDRPEGEWLQGKASNYSIQAYEFIKTDGSLRLLKQYLSDYVGENSIYMTTTKSGDYLYAVNSLIGTNEESNVISFRIDKKNNGELVKINSVQGTGGQNAVHISLDENENFLYIAHYSDGGALSVYKRNCDGSIGPRVFLDNFNSGNLHNLGQNKILNYESNELTGQCIQNPNQLNGLSTEKGPRHLAFHSNGLYAYIVHEFSNDISILSIDSSSGILSIVVEKISTLPLGVSSDGQSAGAIRVSLDQKFLYASNRGNTNSISAFRILENGRQLSYIGTYDTFGKVPRDFYVLKEHLIVLNQNSANAFTFKINLDGSLTKSFGPMNIGLPLAIIAVEL
ncbi:3-carboxymuconate cyclase [Brachionus plicatilis]|uniref:3-carboxymuconate cyclase n=1 Tax=Brachionus plicatilis TaxID=10195 RepID=A0A3M7Q6J1_BRAPC|nr:3-carboxymuconate cyclase [Brachionus plicatilis]